MACANTSCGVAVSLCHVWTWNGGELGDYRVHEMFQASVDCKLCVSVGNPLLVTDHVLCLHPYMYYCVLSCVPVFPL